MLHELVGNGLLFSLGFQEALKQESKRLRVTLQDLTTIVVHE